MSNILKGAALAVLCTAFCLQAKALMYATEIKVQQTGSRVGIGTASPSNELEISTTPEANGAHLFLGIPTAVSEQVSSRMTFGGAGIQHAGLAWVPNTNMSQVKLHLSFGGSNNPMLNTSRVTFQSDGHVSIQNEQKVEQLEEDLVQLKGLLEQLLQNVK